jgi:Flp pilus assembly protein TadG
VRRNAERGSVAIVVAALWMALFAMAALAVDAGHMYLTKRNLQEAADAAVMAGLPSLANNTTTAQSNASAMAQASGYAAGNITTSTGTSGGMRTLTVTITTSEPFFFAKALGYTSKTMRATSVGQAANQVPAVFAGTNSCIGSPTPVGIQVNGGPVTITGDVESNGSANVYGTATITGSTTYGSGSGCGSNISGASNAGGSLTSPYSYTTSSFGSCTFGSLTTAGTLSIGTGGAPWWASGGPSGGTLVSGVYCANGNIDVSAGVNISGTVTFVATGRVTISSSSVNFTAYSNGIIAYAGATSDCYSNQAINVGSADVTMNGSFDAPNGCINDSGNNIAINGSLVGSAVQIGVGGTSSINPSAGGGASYWLYQ